MKTYRLIPEPDTQGIESMRTYRFTNTKTGETVETEAVNYERARAALGLKFDKHTGIRFRVSFPFDRLTDIEYTPREKGPSR